MTHTLGRGGERHDQTKSHLLKCDCVVTGTRRRNEAENTFAGFQALLLLLAACSGDRRNRLSFLRTSRTVLKGASSSSGENNPLPKEQSDQAVLAGELALE